METEPAPTIYLGVQANERCRQVLLDGPKAVAPEDAPAILIAFPQLEKLLLDRSRWRVRSYCIDSGAFSAWNSGAVIDLDDYIRTTKELLATDPLLTEVFALDVIGDWRASLRNTEAMWAAGVPAIPTYHLGEPEDVLTGIARDYPKIAIGGIAKLRGAKKKWFAEQCFARVWPKKIHGFGVGTREMVLAVPWSSVDATSWEIGPGGFGKWRAFGGAQLAIRGSAQDLRAELQYYRNLEQLARHRWRREDQSALGPSLSRDHCLGRCMLAFVERPAGQVQRRDATNASG